MHLEIKLGTQVAETVSSAVIDKLYNLAFEDPNKNVYSPLDSSSVVWGNITAPAAYEDAVVYLRERFAQNANANLTYGLTILVDPNDYYIRFKDNNLLLMLMYNRPSSNQNQIGRIGDGIGITKRAASSTGSFGTDYNNIFYVENDGTIGFGTNNTGILASSITSFDELGYFGANRIQLSNGPAHASRYTNLESIDLTNITDIPESCFRGCTNLRMEVNCPSLTSIGGGAFVDSGIIKIESLGQITTTGYYNNLSLGPFTRCTSLTSAKLPDGIISIGNNCFLGCTSLKDVACSWTSLVSIGASAFSRCVSLDFNNRPLYFPSLTSIGLYSFGNNSPISAMYAPRLQITSDSFKGRYNTSNNFEEVIRINGVLYLKSDTAWELPAGSFLRSHIGVLVLDGVVPTINSGANGTFAQTNIVGSTSAGSGMIGGVYVSDMTQCTAANGWSDIIDKGLLHNISELDVATKNDWDELETDVERRTVLISEYCGKTPTI